MKTIAQGPLTFSGSNTLTVTGSNTFYSDPYWTQNITWASVHISASTTANYTSSIQISNDVGLAYYTSRDQTYVSRSFDVVNWSTVDAPTTTVKANSGVGCFYNLPDWGGKWLRLKIVTSNVANTTGSLSALAMCKGQS